MRQRPRANVSSRPCRPCGPYPVRATAAQGPRQPRRAVLLQQNLYDSPERFIGSDARGLAGVLDPAAAERAVEIDQVGQALHACVDERELRVVKTGLRGQHRQIVVDTVAVTKPRAVEAALLGRSEADLRGNLLG